MSVVAWRRAGSKAGRSGVGNIFAGRREMERGLAGGEEAISGPAGDVTVETAPTCASTYTHHTRGYTRTRRGGSLGSMH